MSTGFMAGLIVIAVMAPGTPSHGKRPTGGQSAVLVARGHALFVTNCSPCHGAGAEGDDGPNLHHKNLPDRFIAGAVRSGFKGEMPSFVRKLKAPEVRALVAYVHSVQK